MQTNARSASLYTSSPANEVDYAFLPPLAGVALYGLRRRIRARMRLAASSMIVLAVTTALAGCGETDPPGDSPTGTSPLTVTDASGTLSQTMKVNFTIN